MLTHCYPLLLFLMHLSPESRSDDTAVELWSAFQKSKALAQKQFDDEAKSLWGDHAAFSGVKTWVNYLDDGRARIRVNYESGEVVVESIGKTARPDESARLASMLKSATEQSGGESQIDSEQFDVSDIGSGSITRARIVGDDGVKREIVSLHSQLVPDHLKIRATRFLPIINKYASLYSVDPAFVLAIMRQESAFNVHARSPVGAIGLMQIMPQFAGREVNRHFGRDHNPSEEQLFEPETNVRFGVKYLQLLSTEHLALVGDPVKRDYLVTCSYNWGPERIVRGIESGRIDVLASSDALFYRLLEVVPSETEGYLRMVTKYRKEFSQTQGRN